MNQYYRLLNICILIGLFFVALTEEFIFERVRGGGAGTGCEALNLLLQCCRIPSALSQAILERCNATLKTSDHRIYCCRGGTIGV